MMKGKPNSSIEQIQQRRQAALLSRIIRLQKTYRDVIQEASELGVTLQYTEVDQTKIHLASLESHSKLKFGWSFDLIGIAKVLESTQP